MTTWLLDLDNTLHDAMPVIMPRINVAMTGYVARRLGLSAEDASAVRVRYWQLYGATLLGMVRHHDVDPHEFLRETHPFPDLHRIVRRDHKLRAALLALPGRRIVLTNAPQQYAIGVLRALGVLRLLDGVIPIEAMRWGGRLQPKPSRPMYRKVLARLRVRAADAVLVEDTVENLRHARICGIRTVLVTSLAHGHRHPSERPRAGRGRRIGVQIQSFTTLPRQVQSLRPIKRPP